MKIRGRLEDILQEINHEKHAPFIHETEKGKVICVRMKKMLCGMLKSSLLCCEKFVKDIKEIGCELNPCGMCVENKIVNNKKQTLTWHADDAKASHADPKVNNQFAK